MRCTECNYPLWNTPAGNCPECGVPFRPSTHAFRVGEVRFRCPDCNQDYFGDDHDGHLRPSEFDCVQCGRHLHEDDCLLFPAEGDMDTVADVRTPWFDSGRGRFRRWMGTVGWSLTQPGKLIDSIPSSTGALHGLGFFLCNLLAIFLVGLAPVFVFMVIQYLATPGMGVSMSWMGSLLIYPVVILVLVGLQTAITHVGLLISGGTAYGFSRTMLATTFSTGPFLLMLVPCVGMCISPVSIIWWIVATIIMVHVGQKVGGVRASLTVLVMPILALAIWGGFIGYSIYQDSNRTVVMNAPVTAVAQAQQAQNNLFVTTLIEDYEASGGSLRGPEAKKSAFPNQTWDGPEGSFKEGSASGWWVKDVFVCAMDGDTLDLTILIYTKEDNALMNHWKTDTSMSKSGQSGPLLETMIQDVQDDREKNGYPPLPEKPLQEWVDSLQP